MKAKGSTAKHAKSAKHVKSVKHNPPPKNAAMSAAAKAKAQAAAQAAAKAHVHAVGKPQQHAKPAKWSPTADVACCAIEALAASLLLATGRHVSAADMLDLYWRATDDADAGLTLTDAFAAAAEYGLAGVHLLDAKPARNIADGTVLGVDLEQRHALVADGHGVWTWGSWRLASCGLLAAADEAWELTWQ